MTLSSSKFSEMMPPTLSLSPFVRSWVGGDNLLEEENDYSGILSIELHKWVSLQELQEVVFEHDLVQPLVVNQLWEMHYPAPQWMEIVSSYEHFWEENLFEVLLKALLLEGLVKEEEEMGEGAITFFSPSLCSREDGCLFASKFILLQFFSSRKWWVCQRFSMSPQRSMRGRKGMWGFFPVVLRDGGSARSKPQTPW